jgi:small subunit ribosomal protein S2
VSDQLAKSLIDAGVHFGHRASRWNPKMKPYIFGKRNLIHIIDVRETIRGILLARKYLQKAVADGKDVLFVGTKRQARTVIAEAAADIQMHWVTERWLGGTLTNFHEIRKRVARLEELEQMEADNLLDTYSKKQGATLRRELRKVYTNLNGLRKMTRLPGALVVVGQGRELIAVKEAKKLGIPVICLLDTDSDPDLIDIPIPGNDDAMRSIEIVIDTLVDAIRGGVGARTEGKDDDGEPRRRSKRPAMGQATEAAPAAPVAAAPAVEAAPAPAPEAPAAPEAPKAPEAPAAE